jgi:hypothetical protein
MSQSWRWTLLPLFVALALFANAIAGAGFVADDNFNLAEHARHGDLIGEWTTPTYAHAGGERGHIWRPIPATLQHTAALYLGRTGSVFRGLNLGVHLINLLLVALVARRWGAHASIAGMLALLWTTHPSLPEAVCWSSDIYDLMATTAMLGAAAIVASRALSARHWVGLSILLLAACLCKESAMAVLPALALLTSYRHGLRKGVIAGAVMGIGVALYWGWHHQVTAQGYLDAAGNTALIDMADAWLMLFGWFMHVPARAPMAHLFDRTADLAEVWAGVFVLLGLLFFAADQARKHPDRRILGVTLAAVSLLLVPAAIGIPFIGIAPLRYVYMPLALLIAVGASAWTEPIRRPWMMGLLLASLIGAVRSSDRVPAFDNDGTLWSAELNWEPTNPYAAGSLARAMIADGRPGKGIALWAQAIDRAKPGIRVFEKSNERWLLAQTAFMKRQPAMALQQVDKLMEEASSTGRSVPPMAHCLRADSLDALGQHQRASAAAVHCPH